MSEQGDLLPVSMRNTKKSNAGHLQYTYCTGCTVVFSDPTKYFGCELGAQTQFDLKNERYIVNGAHDAAKLQDILDGFIKRFVLCQECDNPETRLVSSFLERVFLSGW